MRKLKNFYLEALKSKVYNDLEEFFKAVDGVVIATPPNVHMQCTPRWLQNVEKV